VTRWLITGAGGMLGLDLQDRLRAAGEQVTALARRDLDVTNAAAVRAAVRRVQPGVVINCAAWTAVDAAEAHEAAALAVNGAGPANLAAVCACGSMRLVQLSTDYVFDGMARLPYAEDAVPAPRTAYGRTKLAGERAVLGQLPGTGYVVRTAWLYGARGSNFVRTMIRLERARASRARHIFRLAARNAGEMYPTDHAPVGHRAIRLRQAEPIAQVTAKFCSAKPFMELSPAVPVNMRGEDPRAINT